MKKTKILNVILPPSTVLFIFAVWLVAGAIINNEYILPTVSQTFVKLWQLLGEGAFYSCYFATLLRSIIAFAVSFLLALATGLLGRKFPSFEKGFAPVVMIIRVLPTVAVVLLLLFWVNRTVAPALVTTLVVFPTMYNSVRESLNTVDIERVEMCRTFGVSQKDLIFKVQLPWIMPSMLETVGGGLSLNLKLMVAAEVLASTYVSLGNLLNMASMHTEMAMLLGVVLLCVLTGILIEFVFKAISKKVGKWQ